MASKKHQVNWISETEATNAAQQGILKYELDKDPEVLKVLESGYPGKPLKVTNLDNPRSSYYLIPWFINDSVFFVVKVSSSKGEFLAISKYPKPIKSPFLSSKEALNIVQKAYTNYQFKEPKLVWKACNESTSPNRPLFKISYADGDIYIDMDGRIFEELTPLGLGG